MHSKTPTHAAAVAASSPQQPASQRQVGRYLVSALVSSSGNGWFASAVSIRSGSGSATTDRVLRLTRLFRSAREAAACAHAEALRWIGSPRRRALAA